MFSDHEETSLSITAAPNTGKTGESLTHGVFAVDLKQIAAI